VTILSFRQVLLEKAPNKAPMKAPNKVPKKAPKKAPNKAPRPEPCVYVCVAGGLMCGGCRCRCSVFIIETTSVLVRRIIFSLLPVLGIPFFLSLLLLSYLLFSTVGLIHSKNLTAAPVNKHLSLHTYGSRLYIDLQSFLRLLCAFFITSQPTQS
jgi:hypothetical protein